MAFLQPNLGGSFKFWVSLRSCTTKTSLNIETQAKTEPEPEAEAEVEPKAETRNNP